MPQSGNIELSFKDTDATKAAPIGVLLDKEMKLIPTGKYKQHTTIRLAAPKIAVFDDFTRDQPKVEAALLNAERLWQLVQQKRPRIDEILGQARGT